MPEPAPRAPAPPSAAGAPRALRVLVVDDSEDAVTTMALLLQMSGHETRTAADGIDALQQARDFAPDVVLLDIGLPGLSGLQVAQRLRAESGGDKLLLVALTGLAPEADQRESERAGFDAHLIKPVQIDRLLDLLASYRPAAGLRSGGGASSN